MSSALLVVAGLVVWMGIGRHTGPSFADIAGAAEPASGKPTPAPKTSALPPLKVDRGAPLLLEEPPKKKPRAKDQGPVADNHACHVCHTNYEEELMAVQHAEADVGCVECHGQSAAHRNDENNITPPDKMYPAEAIDASCVKCHETHDAPARKVIAQWQERCAGKKDLGQMVCTDCHGEHRLKIRTVRWDKKTGKLTTSPGQGATAAPGATQPKAVKQPG